LLRLQDHENVKYLPGYILPDNLIAGHIHHPLDSAPCKQLKGGEVGQHSVSQFLGGNRATCTPLTALSLFSDACIEKAVAGTNILVFVIPHQFIGGLCEKICKKVAPDCIGIYVASKSGEEEDEEDGEEEEEEKKKKRKKMESAGACLGIHVASELGEEDDEEEKKKKKRKSKSKGKSKSKSKSKSKRKDEEDEDEGDDEQDDEEDEEDEEGCNTTDGMPAPVSSPPAFDDAPPGGIKGPEDKAPEVVSFCESILLFYTGLGMELVSVPGDGACLFYCLASWIKVFRTILWSTLMGAVPVAGDTVRVAREVECASAEDANTVRSAAVDYMQKYGVLNGWHGSIVPVTPEGGYPSPALFFPATNGVHTGAHTLGSLAFRWH